MFSDSRPLTGRAVLWVTLGAFGIIIGANVVLTVFAVGTFPGLEVENSYVASQTFDAEADAQRALGWNATVAQNDGKLTLSLTDASGHPVDPARLTVTATRPTEARDDRALPLTLDGSMFVGAADLPPGRWRIRIEATAGDGTPFRTIRDLTVGAEP